MEKSLFTEEIFVQALEVELTAQPYTYRVLDHQFGQPIAIYQNNSLWDT
jgi:hypothetical protein